MNINKSRLYKKLRKTPLFYILIFLNRIKARGIFTVLKDAVNIIAGLLSLKSKIVISAPPFAQIEPTSKCNLSCRMCITANSNQNEGNDLSYEDFCRLIGKLPNLVCINLQGNGEPLLNESFFKMTQYAAKKGIAVFTCTNAMLFDGQTIENILSCGLFELGISMESNEKNIYEYIRKGSDFQLVVSNIKNLIEKRNIINPKLAVKLWVTLMDYNINQIPEMINFASDLGVDGICFQNLQTKYDYAKNYNDKLKKEIRFTKKLFFKKYGKAIKESKLYITLKTKCFWPWLGIYIKSSGEVTPCCVTNEYICGNLLKEDLKNIWNNDSYQNIRHSLINENNNFKYCAKCSFK